jgi:Ribonuclease G/E
MLAVAVLLLVGPALAWAALVWLGGASEGEEPSFRFSDRIVTIEVAPEDAGGLRATFAGWEEGREGLTGEELLAEIQLDEGMGLVVRSAAADGDDTTIREDMTATLKLARQVISEPLSAAPEKLLDGADATDLAWRDWPIPDDSDAEPGSFSRHGIDSAIERLDDPSEALPGAGTMFVEATRALVAVDVNTGADTSPAAGLKANLAAVHALPRALRLRGLGGQVVLDLAPMPKRDRRHLEQAVARAFRSDPIETSVVGWTPLGHLELQRKRERLPLKELFL